MVCLHRVNRYLNFDHIDARYGPIQFRNENVFPNDTKEEADIQLLPPDELSSPALFVNAEIVRPFPQVPKFKRDDSGTFPRPLSSSDCAQSIAVAAQQETSLDKYQKLPEIQRDRQFGSPGSPKNTVKLSAAPPNSRSKLNGMLQQRNLGDATYLGNGTWTIRNPRSRIPLPSIFETEKPITFGSNAKDQ